jgi:hypothetical protein
MRSAFEPIVASRPRAREPVRRAPMRAPAAAPSPAEIGALFRDLRRVLGLSRPELAHRLGARLDVIEALETGTARRLPPWPEIVRIVTAFTGLARIDPGPVLSVLHQLVALEGESGGRASSPRRGRAILKRIGWAAASAMTAASQVAAARRLTTKAAHLAPPAGWQHLDASSGWRRKLLILLAIAPLVFAASIAEPGLRQAAVSALPAPLAHLLREAQDYIVWQMAPTREGLKWIEVDDPRTRRGDKLQTSGH